MLIDPDDTEFSEVEKSVAPNHQDNTHNALELSELSDPVDVPNAIHASRSPK